MPERLLDLANAEAILSDYAFLEEMPRIFPGTEIYFMVTLYLEREKQKDRYKIMAGLKYTDGRSDTVEFTEFSKRMEFEFHPEDYDADQGHSPLQ